MSNSAFTPTFAQNLQDASTTQSGLVNTSAQTFAGAKTFNVTTDRLKISSNGVELQPRTDGLTDLSGTSAVMSWSTTGLSANLVSTTNLNAGANISYLRGFRVGNSVHWAGEIRVNPTAGSQTITAADFNFGHSSIPAGMRSVTTYPTDGVGYGRTVGSAIVHVDGVNETNIVSAVGLETTTTVSFRFRSLSVGSNCRIGFSIIVPI